MLLFFIERSKSVHYYIIIYANDSIVLLDPSLKFPKYSFRKTSGLDTVVKNEAKAKKSKKKIKMRKITKIYLTIYCKLTKKNFRCHQSAPKIPVMYYHSPMHIIYTYID